MEHLRLRLLGYPLIERDGTPVDPGRRRVLALAAYLGVNDGPRAKDSVCAVLWPEKSAAAARAELRRTVSVLRSCTGAEVVSTTHADIALAPGTWVDVRSFRTLSEATVGRPECDCRSPDCVRAMEEAVTLYNNDFLSGFSLSDSAAFDDWTLFEAERLRDSLHLLLERLSRPSNELGGASPSRSTAVEYARRWLQLDESNEAAHRRLMVLRALNGQRGAALKQFDACKRALDREVGASPSDETLALKQRIERGTMSGNVGTSDSDGAGRAQGGEHLPPSQSRFRRGKLKRAALVSLALSALTVGGLFAYFSAAHRAATEIPIAVLPLLDDSNGAHNTWFAGGMTDAIITDLARIRSLRVTSRSSVEVIGANRPTIADIRSRLGVDYVVEGSVLRASNRVRITAQLIDAKFDRHMWADTYEGDLDDIIGLQGRIAEDIASHVSARLSPTEARTLTRSRPVNPHAYEAYLLGAYELSRLPFDIEIAGRCLADLERSIEIDPDFAPAHAALGNYYWGATQFGLYPNEEGMKRAEVEAKRAVFLDEGLSEAHTVLGFVRFLHDYDWKGSEREFRLAIQLKPSSAEAHTWYGSLLCTMGKFDEGIAEVTTARSLDPLSLINALNVAMRLYYARDFDGAIEQAEIARDMERGFYMSHLVLGYALTAKGSYDMAIGELEDAARLAGDGAMEPLAVLAYAFHRAGRSAEATAAEERFKALAAKGMSISPLLQAYIPLGRGDYSAAMDFVEKAFAEHDLNLAWNFRDPFFDPLRTLPRFVRMKREMKL